VAGIRRRPYLRGDGESDFAQFVGLLGAFRVLLRAVVFGIDNVLQHFLDIGFLRHSFGRNCGTPPSAEI
jgi:hypothetical protein